MRPCFMTRGMFSLEQTPTTSLAPGRFASSTRAILPRVRSRYQISRLWTLALSHVCLHSRPAAASDQRGRDPNVTHRKNVTHALLHKSHRTSFAAFFLKWRIYNLLFKNCTVNGRLESKWGFAFFRPYNCFEHLQRKNFVPGISLNV